MALIADLLAAGNWQRAGNRKAKRPKPLPRPWVKQQAGQRLGGSKRHSLTSSEVDRVMARWNTPRPGRVSKTMEVT